MTNFEKYGRYSSGFPYKALLIWVIFIMIAVSAGAIYFLFSTAVIAIYPKVETKEVDFEVTLDSQASSVDYENNVIHGVLLKSQVSGEKAIKDIPAKKIDENARGQITLTNKYSRAIRFNKGDVLVAQDVVPAQKVALDRSFILYRGQTKTVDAYAVEKGIGGQIAPTTFRIEKYNDYMNQVIIAQSEKAFTGGVRTATIITEGDILAEKNLLLSQLKQKNLEILKNKISDSEVLTQDNMYNEIIAFTSNVDPPVEQDHFKISMELKSIGAVYRQEELTSLIKKNLEKKASNNQEFDDLNQENLSIAVHNLDPAANRAILNIQVKGRFISKIPSDVFNKEAIKGYNERAVKSHYEKFPDIEKVEVEFFPDFKKTVPEIDRGINIEVRKPQPEDF
ncbi:MAG: hypothetical protein GF332_03445 [Candidatus Moranbacteria bacterium]|nr:hypothetical protein [Candidatus Moranbacteria bacterium]